MKIIFIITVFLFTLPCHSSSIEKEFHVSTIIDKFKFFNSRMVITGLNGSALTSGDLVINADGSFSSEKSIVTEAHLFDVESEKVLGLVTSKDTSRITWRVITDPFVYASGSSDVFSAKAILFNHSFYGTTEVSTKTPPVEGSPDVLSRVDWSIKSKKDGSISYMNPGDSITVIAQINLEAAI